MVITSSINLKFADGKRKCLSVHVRAHAKSSCMVRVDKSLAHALHEDGTSIADYLTVVPWVELYGDRNLTKQ